MSTHEMADYQILLDNASNYVLSHAAVTGMKLQPLLWDEGAPGMLTALHRLRIATMDATEELRIPHEWLPLEAEGHNRFRTEVEAALARLRAGTRGGEAARLS